jgi:hypothetical protein
MDSASPGKPAESGQVKRETPNSQIPYKSNRARGQRSRPNDFNSGGYQVQEFVIQSCLVKLGPNREDNRLVSEFRQVPDK